MVKNRPLSPPASNEGEMYQVGFHQGTQRNRRVPLPPDFSYGPRMEMPAQNGRLCEPLADSEEVYRYGTPDGVYGYHTSNGLETSYDQYPQQYLTDLDPYKHQSLEDHTYTDRYDTPAQSPSAPSISTPSSSAIRTRSGLAVKRRPRASSGTSRRKSVPTKKGRKEKVKNEKKVAKLDKPLSELTESWTHVPVVDIESYVNRSAEERRKEIEQGKQPGRVKRPMNSFMLYRKAYQNRTKNWCLQNNHQVVSQVCGDSWPLEPIAIREQYNEWARIERMNHQDAHPGYKFSPSKAGISKPVKRKKPEEPDSELSDLEDFDWEHGQSGRKPKRTGRVVARRQLHDDPDASYQPNDSPYAFSREVSFEPMQPRYHESSFGASNPGKAPPPQYSQDGLLHGQYYQQTVHSTPNIPGAEDVVIRRANAPGGHHGLQGNHTYHLIDEYDPMDNGVIQDYKIDPSLMAQGSGLYDSGYFEQDLGLYADMGLDSSWQVPYDAKEMGIYDMPSNVMSPPPQYDIPLHVHKQDLDTLKGNQEGWQVETLDPGQEFDKWMDEPNA